MPGIETVTVIALHFDNGLLGLVKSSSLDPRKVWESTIVGSKKIRIYDKHVEVPLHFKQYIRHRISRREIHG